jgi:hypothetical protein
MRLITSQFKYSLIEIKNKRIINIYTDKLWSVSKVERYKSLVMQRRYS